MEKFILGMSTFGHLAAALFFWRFWQKTSDALFVAFGAAFVLFAANQLFLSMQEKADFPHSWPFIFRLAGFGLMIFAILRKNLK